VLSHLDPQLDPPLTNTHGLMLHEPERCRVALLG
jgi:hypothetical protein